MNMVADHASSARCNWTTPPAPTRYPNWRARARSGQHPERAPQLIAHVHSTLHTGDARILPEALFALHDAPRGRERLIDTACALIAQPDVARPDGSFVPYELWAIPLLYSTNHAGDCWFFRVWPNWARAAKHLGIPYGKGLHVSPTLFTPDMLNASGCQGAQPAGRHAGRGRSLCAGRYCRHAHRLPGSKAAFLPRMTLNWIVFAVERGCTDARTAGRPQWPAGRADAGSRSRAERAHRL